MKQGKRKLYFLGSGILILSLMTGIHSGIPVNAAESESAPSLHAGAGALLDPRVESGDLQHTLFSVDMNPAGNDTGGNYAPAASAGPLTTSTGTSGGDSGADKTSTLVMADVNQVMNVRALPDASSEKVGVLYKDCGGTILERGDGWTKLKSGKLVGWASNDYLLFGAEAEELAAEVGVLTATVTTDTLRVRKGPSTDSGVYGLVKTGDQYEVVREDDGSGFVLVNYDGKEGYLSADFVKIDFQIDTGETMAAIQAREEAEKRAKAEVKRKQNQGKVDAKTDEVKLLAALVQCEAGHECYDGQLGVAAVVMNRVRNGAYPSSIYGVIYASGQFSPAANGKLAAAYANNTISASCLRAAQAAVGGETTVGSAVHFRRTGSHEGIVIGNHVFW